MAYGEMKGGPSEDIRSVDICPGLEKLPGNLYQPVAGSPMEGCPNLPGLSLSHGGNKREKCAQEVNSLPSVHSDSLSIGTATRTVQLVEHALRVQFGRCLPETAVLRKEYDLPPFGDKAIPEQEKAFPDASLVDCEKRIV